MLSLLQHKSCLNVLLRLKTTSATTVSRFSLSANLFIAENAEATESGKTVRNIGYERRSISASIPQSTERN